MNNVSKIMDKGIKKVTYIFVLESFVLAYQTKL
jgi:hypothetical protein